MEDTERFYEHVRNSSDAKRILFYIEKINASGRTELINQIHSEIYLREQQSKSYGRALWRGLLLSIVPLALFLYLDVWFLINLWAVGATSGFVGSSFFLFHNRNELEVLVNRRRALERQPHYSVNFDSEQEKRDFKTTQRLWGYVSGTFD